LTRSLNFDRRSLRSISIAQFLDEYEVTITAKSGDVVFKESMPIAVADGVVRALLCGRSAFAISYDRSIMDAAVTEFIEWIRKAEKDITQMIAESALGTGYEVQLKKEVFARVGMHPSVGAKLLPTDISLG
jgi:hypothetical protein